MFGIHEVGLDRHVAVLHRLGVFVSDHGHAKSVVGKCRRGESFVLEVPFGRQYGQVILENGDRCLELFHSSPGNGLLDLVAHGAVADLMLVHFGGV